MLNGVLCRLFKKEKVSMMDVVEMVISALVGFSMISLFLFSLGVPAICVLYNHHPIEIMSEYENTLGYAIIIGVGLLTCVVFGIGVIILVKLGNLIEKLFGVVGKYLNNITVAECPMYKDKDE
jgi:hypothetical protein